MLAVHTSQADVVWALVDVSRGIGTRCVLQDALFLGQELKLLPETIKFPAWAGIGTARYSEELDRIIDDLIRSGRIYDSGGPATLCAIKRSPTPARSSVARLAGVVRRLDAHRISMIAAYLMARRREASEGVRNKTLLRDRAAARLGWPETLVTALEDMIRQISKHGG